MKTRIGLTVVIAIFAIASTVTLLANGKDGTWGQPYAGSASNCGGDYVPDNPPTPGYWASCGGSCNRFDLYYCEDPGSGYDCYANSDTKTITSSYGSCQASLDCACPDAPF